jgi:membrane protein
VALKITIGISFSLFIAIIIMIVGDAFISYVKSKFHGQSYVWIYADLIALSNWIIVVLIFFVTVSLLYRYGPAHERRRWRFVNPGSVLATSLAILTSFGFSFYINNFSAYNKVYGSIGTLIVVMIWLYLNSLIILIGFELNASVDLSKRTIKIVKPRYNTFRIKKTEH